MQLWQYMCNMYKCWFQMAPHSDLNDGTLSPQCTWYSVWPRAVLNEEKKKKCSCTQVSRKCPWAHHVLVVGGWRLAVGDLQLVAVDGGWRQLVVVDWWRVAVVGGWRLVTVGVPWGGP